MNRTKSSVIVLLGLALVLSGCLFKKSSEQASLSTADTSGLTDELAQLPEATSTSTQQTGIEVLPIETSPITQAAPLPLPPSGTQAIHSAATATVDAATAGVALISRDKQIQTALKNAGLYQGSIDGKIGPATKKAIETFQANQGLKVDGKVGPKTWAALEAFLTPSTGSGSASSQ